MITNKEAILVTGASGQLGRLALEWLVKNYDGPIMATTRSPEKLSHLAAQGVMVRRADFDQPETLADAFAGAARVLLISTDAVAVPGQRLKQHKDAIQAAVKAGVQHIVYTSLVNCEPGTACLIAEDHYQTEEAIKSSGVAYTILRNNLYADNLLGALPQAVATGQLATAAGEGRTAYVTRQDCAFTAAAALASASQERLTLDVTGPDALSGYDIAHITSGVTGKNVQYLPLETAKMVEIFESIGMPTGVAQAYVSFDTAAAKGEYKQTTNTVQELTGQAPTSLKQFLSEHKHLLVSTQSE